MGKTSKCQPLKDSSPSPRLFSHAPLCAMTPGNQDRKLNVEANEGKMLLFTQPQIKGRLVGVAAAVEHASQTAAFTSNSKSLPVSPSCTPLFYTERRRGDVTHETFCL